MNIKVKSELECYLIMMTCTLCVVMVVTSVHPMKINSLIIKIMCKTHTF